MDTAESVSKGCFAYKGKKKTVNPATYFAKKDVGCEARLSAYESLWESIDTDIKIMQSDLNSQIFEELLAFAGSSHSPQVAPPDSSRTQFRKAITEIPTAALITGVNTPDHAVMFSNLIDLMKERVTSLVATLRSKDCPHLKTTLSKMISQLTSNPELILDDEEEDVAPKKKQAACTLATLTHWYNSKFRSAGSSPKKRRSGGGAVEMPVSKPPLVVVLEDMESFLPHVLQDLITICSNYIHELPLVLVFGIATSVTAVHRLLPNSVSSLLCMEKFQAPPSSEYLTQVINKVLMTANFPFKLGPKVFQLLLDVFLYHDFSVLNFIKGLQFCMLEHFYSHPLSHLCCPLVEIDTTVSTLSHKELDKLRQIPSFISYMNKTSPKKQTSLKDDDKFLKSRVKDLLVELHDYHSSFFPILQCLNVWASVLPRYPLGKQLRELYAISLESDICETEGYKEAMALFRMLSKDELSSLTTSCMEKLMMTDLPSELDDLPEQLTELLHVLEKDEDEEEPPEPEEKEEVVKFTKTNLHSLRKTLKEMGKKRRFSPFERQREKVVDFFDSLFRKYLKCPSSQTLNEVVYYTSVSSVRRHINASPRLAIQKALSNPSKYLQCDCCDGEHGMITPTMPDICIVYKLHLECPQLINLYDWLQENAYKSPKEDVYSIDVKPLQAFITVLSEEGDKRTKDEDSLLQARFIHAVSELQFLGFIKPTKRKTDHVARLTWGGC